MTEKEIIQETRDYYDEDPSRRALSGMSCEYCTIDGRKCAVGRCMLDEVNKPFKFVGPVSSIHRNGVGRVYDFESYLKKKYRGFSIPFWVDLQKFHDTKEHWTSVGISKQGQEYFEKLINKYNG